MRSVIAGFVPTLSLLFKFWMGQDVLILIVSFYTWTCNNIPLELHSKIWNKMSTHWLSKELIMYRQNVDFPLFRPPQMTIDTVPSVQLKHNHSNWWERTITHYSVLLQKKKNIPNIFSCNFRKHRQIFIMFGTHVIEKVSNQ